MCQTTVKTGKTVKTDKTDKTVKTVKRLFNYIKVQDFEFLLMSMVCCRSSSMPSSSSLYPSIEWMSTSYNARYSQIHVSSSYLSFVQ